MRSSVQERLVEVTGNLLTLSTRPMLLGGTEQTARLVWERVRTKGGAGPPG